MKIRQTLRKAPVTVPPECTIAEAAKLMYQHQVGTLLVMAGDELRGLVTDRDLVVRALAAGADSSTPVGEVMSHPVICVQGDDDIVEALRILRTSSFRRLPVLEEDQLAGILTVDDLLVGLVLELAAAVSPIAAEVVAHKP
ncbi:MAG TPA: CBS domain-containing protein [Acidimicrobiales bacterium]|jgi:CBS domain-containing protein|nr:CBS domain-containing protein [Acidimicrobiales bacterium]